MPFEAAKSDIISDKVTRAHWGEAWEGLESAPPAYGQEPFEGFRHGRYRAIAGLQGMASLQVKPCSERTSC